MTNRIINHILACGNGDVGGCSWLFDFKASKVSLAKSEEFNYYWTDETSNRLKDVICSSLPSNEWAVEAREASEPYIGTSTKYPPMVSSCYLILLILPGS